MAKVYFFSIFKAGSVFGFLKSGFFGTGVYDCGLGFFWNCYGFLSLGLGLLLYTLVWNKL